MHHIEKDAKLTIDELAQQYGASTMLKTIDVNNVRVLVSNGEKQFAFSFPIMARSKFAAIKNIEADMRAAVRAVGLWQEPVHPQLAAQIRSTPKRAIGMIGEKMQEAVRVPKPAETEQPSVSFPHVVVPERKPRGDAAILKRIKALEKTVAEVKQITDQLR